MSGHPRRASKRTLSVVEHDSDESYEDRRPSRAKRARTATHASEAEAPPVAPDLELHLARLIERLQKSAAEKDVKAAFSSHFKGHLPQLKRDVHFFLQGFARKLPDAWLASAQTLQEEDRRARLRSDPDYAVYSSLRERFEGPPPAPARGAGLPGLELEDETWAASRTIIDKFELDDAGRLRQKKAPAPGQAGKTGASPAKHKADFVSVNAAFQSLLRPRDVADPVLVLK